MPPKKEVYIIKSDGTKEIFNPEKLLSSLKKNGTTSELADSIVSKIISDLAEGNTTKEIYRQAFNLLKKNQRPAALRYSLKRAIAELGPSGFPFERFVGEIFKAQNFKVKIGEVVMGACVPHEVDVVAYNETELIMVEAKFHADFGIRSDLKVALYIKSRFDYLKNNTFKYDGQTRKLTKGMLITNTNFSTTAIQYGECAHLNMIGWNYPQNNNLHKMIESYNLMPVTILTTLNQAEKKMF